MSKLFMLVALIALMVGVPTATASKTPKPVDLNAITHSTGVTVTVSKPIEVSPAEAEAAMQPGWDGGRPSVKLFGTLSGASPGGSSAPMCAVDENGNCMADTSEYWDSDDDGTDGTLGYYDYGNKHCWFNTAAMEAGEFPWQQRVSNDTLWCSMFYAYVSSRVTHVRLGTTFCGKSDAYNQLIGGGRGSNLYWLRSGGSFTCPVTRLGPFHHDHWMDSAWDAVGRFWITEFN